MPHLKLTSFSLFATVFAVLFSCSKQAEDPNSPLPDNTTETVTYSQLLLPCQIASVSVRQLFSNDTIEANLDDSIQLTVFADSHSIYFALPNNAVPGFHSITISDPRITINVECAASLPISDPALFIDTIIANRLTEVQAFAADNFPKEDCDSMIAYCNRLQDIVGGLDTTQTRQLADFLFANQHLFDQINQSLQKLGKINALLATSAISDDTYSEYHRQYNNLLSSIRVNLKTALAGAVIGGVAGSIIPGLGTGAGAVLGALPGGLKLIKNLKNMVVLQFEVGLYKGILNDLSAAGLNKKATTVFQSDVPVIVTVNGVYRSMLPSDGDGDLQVLSGFVKSMSEVSSLWNDAKSKLSPINVFNGSQPLTINDLQSTTVQKSVSGKYLSLGAISNPNVTGKLTPGNPSISLTFHTGSSLEQNFTYEIIYENSGISKKSVFFTGTIAAKQALTGIWKMIFNEGKDFDTTGAVLASWSGPVTSSAVQVIINISGSAGSYALSLWSKSSTGCGTENYNTEASNGFVQFCSIEPGTGYLICSWKNSDTYRLYKYERYSGSFPPSCN